MDATTALAPATRGDVAPLLFARRSERAERHDDEPEHRHHPHRDATDDSASRVFLSLKAQVEGTLRDLGTAPPAAGDAEDTEGPASGTVFDAELKARIRVSGPDGRIDMKLKLELDDVDSATFQSALQSFTETLYAALKSLYGGTAAAPAPAPAPSDSAGVTAAALAADAPAPAPAALPAPTPDPATDASAAVDAASPSPAPAPSTGSVSLQLKLRLTYSSFGDNLGALTQQLARPDGANGVPSSVFGDLGERFAKLMAAAGADGDRLTLGGFLQSLADRLAPKPVDTVLPGEPAPTPAPAASGSVSFMFQLTARYAQVQASAAPASPPLALAA